MKTINGSYGVTIKRGDIRIRKLEGLSPGLTLRAGWAAMIKSIGGTGVPWWIAEGTALGFHRDGDFIPHDTDIDFHLLLDADRPKTVQRVEAALCDGMCAAGFDLIRTEHRAGLVHQLAFADRRNDGVIFDYLVFYRGMVEGQYRHWSGCGYQDIPAAMVDGRRAIQTPYGALIAPHPIEAYCEYRYGDTWRTPIDGKAGKANRCRKR